jgi:prefoldin subunit 5
MKDRANWTIETLKEHLQLQITANKDLVEANIDKLEEAIRLGDASAKSAAELVRTAQDKFEAQTASAFVKNNEFRQSLDDLGKNMALRRELESAVATIDDRIQEVTKQINTINSRLDSGPVGLQSLKTQFDLSAGARVGAKENWGAIVAIIGATGVIVGIVMRFIE